MWFRGVGVTPDMSEIRAVADHGSSGFLSGPADADTHTGLIFMPVHPKEVCRLHELQHHLQSSRYLSWNLRSCYDGCKRLVILGSQAWDGTRGGSVRSTCQAQSIAQSFSAAQRPGKKLERIQSAI